jgi:uncharacterized protein (TIGR03435 family)
MRLRLSVLVIAMSWVSSLTAVSPPQTPAPRAPVSFAAVSIRKQERPTIRKVQSDPAGLHMSGVLRQFIVYAYNIHDYQLAGGGEAIRSRSWTQFEHFSLDASTDGPATDVQLRQMLQGILKTRFGLRLRVDSKPTELLALTVAPGGIKFKPMGDGTPPPFSQAPNTRTLGFRTITELLSSLDTRVMVGGLGMPKKLIVDRTGLTGEYYIRLSLPADTIAGPDGRQGFRIHWSELPAALDAVGLELKPETIPFETYTIEDAHEPTPN